MAQDKLILVATASSQIEASIWRDALEQDGIIPFIRNSAPLAYLGSDAFFATYNVFVLAADEKRARWVLGEFIDPLPPAEHAHEEQEAAAAD